MKPRRPRHIESLEQRWAMASDWFNVNLGCDVDDSGLVTPRDVLLIVNELNRAGTRTLSDHDAGLPLIDVSNDGALSSIDALLVINAINQASPSVMVAFGIDAADDLNGNGVVLRDQVRLTGQTTANARLTVRNTGSLEAPLEDVTVMFADEHGRFTIPIDLSAGVNRLTVQSRDEMGRVASLKSEIRRGDVLTDWNAAILNVVRDWSTTSNDPYLNRIVPSRPPEVARNLAMIHAAMFDAANATAGSYESYAYTGQVRADASPVAAAARAAYVVASSLYSAADEIQIWQASLLESLQTIPDDAARTKGLDLGQTIGQSMIDLRANDGSRARVNYDYGAGPGVWQRTFPDYLPPLLPQWPDVKPFVMDKADDFQLPPPPALDSPEYAQAVNEVMRLGGLDSTERTPEQTEIALFWSDGGGTATPPGHWNRIASDVLDREQLSLIDSARALALLNMAMADAGIACWNSKYEFKLWRPIDAIRLADTDGNEATVADPDWLPLLRTPPFPSYSSGHSTFSGAAAAVLTELFGEHYAFSSTTDSQSASGQRPLSETQIALRHYSSFEQAAEEAGMSRIYGGIHYLFDSTLGHAAGHDIGTLATQSKLRPKS